MTKQFDVQPITKVLICVLTTHERGGWVNRHLLEWLVNLRFNPNYQTHVTTAHNFIPAASARNFFCKHVKDLEPRPDWLLMIDNDMVPCDNMLDAIKSAPADASIVVPRFVMWDEGKPRMSLCWGMDAEIVPEKDGHQIFTVEPGTYYPLTKCGSGAIFIRPEVFDKIDMPYFWYDYNEDGGMCATEDINFCKKVRAAGLKLYGSGSHDCGHFHNVNLSIVAKLIDDTRKGLDTEAKLGNKEQVELTGDPSLDSVATARPVVVA